MDGPKVIVIIFYIVFVKRRNFDLIETNINGASINEQTSEENGQNIEIKWPNINKTLASMSD